MCTKGDDCYRCQSGMTMDVIRPRNFSWIDEGKLAAFGWPSSAGHLRYLLSEGIDYLVTLSPEKRPPIHSFPQITWVEIKIREFYPPTITQIEKFIATCEEALSKNKAVGVHCWMGRGRTGTMVACYLVKFQKMKAQDAVKLVQSMRPGSVETYTQEDAVMNYYLYLCKNQKT